MILTFLDSLTGLLAPHQCLACGAFGALLCSSCRELLPQAQPKCYRCGRTDQGYATCKTCRKSSALGSVYVCTEYEGFAEKIVRQMKFERAIEATRLIAKIAAIQFGSVLVDDVVIVPVPTATSRVRERGYDQAVVMAKHFSKHTGLPCANALRRLGQQRQTTSTRAQRLAQLDGAFEMKARKLKGVRHVLLIDDVLTTGATLETAARVLKQAGVRRVDGIVFAQA